MMRLGQGASSKSMRDYRCEIRQAVALVSKPLTSLLNLLACQNKKPEM